MTVLHLAHLHICGAACGNVISLSLSLTSKSFFFNHEPFLNHLHLLCLHSEGAERVRFDSMSRGLWDVRRLSTVSSVTKPTYVLTTEWVWFWEDEYGKWIQYASIVSGVKHSNRLMCYEDNNRDGKLLFPLNLSFFSINHRKRCTDCRPSPVKTLRKGSRRIKVLW